jgi:hypothetical protein
LGLFGKHFSASGVFVLVMGAACLEVISSTLFQALVSRGAIWTNVGVTTLWSILLCLVTAPLVGRMGAKALALGFFAAWCACAAVYAGLAMRLFSQTDSEGKIKEASAFADSAA